MVINNISIRHNHSFLSRNYTDIQVFYNVDLVYGYIRGINPFQYNCVGDEDHFSDCPRTYDSTCNNPQWQTFGIRCANVQGGNVNDVIEKKP